MVEPFPLLLLLLLLFIIVSGLFIFKCICPLRVCTMGALSGFAVVNVVKSQHFEITFYKFCFNYLQVSPGKRVEPEEAKKAAAAAAALEEQASLCISKHCECTCCGTGASIRPG